MSVKELTDKNFDDVKKSDKAVVKFSAAWCGPCQMLKPVYEEVSDKVEGVDFYSVDVDEAGDASEKYSVMSVPTMVLMEEGKEKGRLNGAMNAESLESEIKEKLGL